MKHLLMRIDTRVVKMFDRKEYKKQYYIGNKEKISEYNKQYRKDNSEEIKERLDQWRKKNPEYNKQYYFDNKEWFKQYCLNNREKRLEKGKQWHNDNKKHIKEYKKQWKKDNPEYYKGYYQTPKGKAGTQRHHCKRRHLSFIPLNKPFMGCEAHHISENFVIYIPKKIHRWLYHSVWTWQNMEQMNKVAIEFL